MTTARPLVTGPALAAAPAGSNFSYPVAPGTRVPAGAKTVKVLDVSPEAHTVINAHR